MLVKHVKKEAKTAGGIIIPYTAKGKPQEGEVMALQNAASVSGMMLTTEAMIAEEPEKKKESAMSSRGGVGNEQG